LVPLRERERSLGLVLFREKEETWCPSARRRGAWVWCSSARRKRLCAPPREGEERGFDALPREGRDLVPLRERERSLGLMLFPGGKRLGREAVAMTAEERLVGVV
jgi:hypothetical protein